MLIHVIMWSQLLKDSKYQTKFKNTIITNDIVDIKLINIVIFSIADVQITALASKYARV